MLASACLAILALAPAAPAAWAFPTFEKAPGTWPDLSTLPAGWDTPTNFTAVAFSPCVWGGEADVEESAWRAPVVRT